MDVVLTDEQLQWQDAISDLASSHAVTNPSSIPTDVDRGWGEIVAMGAPALRSPELSGVDAAMVESTIAVEEAARHLSALPVVGQGVIAPELLAAAGAQEVLTEVATGSARVAPAFEADLSRFGRSGGESVVFDGAGATHALLLDHDQLRLAEISGQLTNGLDLTRQIGRLGADAGSEAIGNPIPPERLTRATAVALTAIAADLLGVMESALDEATTYAKDRQQFGAAIGSFQAVQHLLADALVSVEGTRSCVWYAAWACDHLDPAEALLAAQTAKAFAAQDGQAVVETTVQAFGGIAITWEHLSHIRLRRMHLDRQCLGDEQRQFQVIAAARLAG